MGCGKSKPADVATGNVTQKKKSFFKSASKREDTNQTNLDIAAKSVSTTSSSGSDSMNISNPQQESEMAISKEDPGTQNVAGVTENVTAVTEKVASGTENITSITENVAAVTENVAGVIQNLAAITENDTVVEDVPQTETVKEGKVVGPTAEKEKEAENVGGGVRQDNVETVEGMTSRDSTNSFSSARKEEENFDSVAFEEKSDNASLQADNSSALVVEEAKKVGDAGIVVETNEFVEKIQPEVAAETEAPAMISDTGDASNADEEKPDSSAKEVKTA